MLDTLSQYQNAIGSILTIWILAVIMPGPDMFLVIRTAIKGKAQAVMCAFGIVAGTFVWLIVGFFLINLLNKTSFFDYMQLAGGCYLIYMSIKIFLSLKNTSNSSYQETPSIQDKFKSFLSGIITNLSNPKPPIFVSIILAKLPPNTPYLIDIFLLSAMLLIPTFWFYFVVEIFTIKKFLNAFLKYAKLIDVIAGIIFGLFGLNLIYGVIERAL